MGEKEEEELKRYLLDSNVKILFEGKNPTPVEITEFPPAFSDRGWAYAAAINRESLPQTMNTK